MRGGEWLPYWLVGLLVASLAVSAASQDVASGVEPSWLAAAKGETLPDGAAIAGDEPEKRYDGGSEPAKTFYACRATIDGALRVGKAEAGGACQRSHWVEW